MESIHLHGKLSRFNHLLKLLHAVAKPGLNRPTPDAAISSPSHKPQRR
jgi:hypothetical protein